MDSLLDYHVSWGMRLASFLHWESRNEILWFQNDLNSQLPAGLPIAIFSLPLYGASSGWPPQPQQISSVTFTHHNPLEFPAVGKVAISGGGGHEISTKGPGVYTLNGVVHAVEDLFFH
ncbi:hypothetical protein SAMN05216436_101117 [bacterium A37T11]|nr:hypothetical protein SAMN05216436_101117 [bacterium A37T11]